MSVSMKTQVTVQILTYNEEQHLARCIESVKPFASQIIIIDSHSTDKTQEIAEELGAEVVLYDGIVSYSHKLNWGLENAPIRGNWIMRLDADEYITPELANEILEKMDSLPEEVAGIEMRRRIHFLGKWMKHGGTYPLWVLRLFKAGIGHCENRWMDQHIVLSEGEAVKFDHDLVDDNLNDITWWTHKHNGYATWEAVDSLNHKYHFTQMDERKDEQNQAMFKRWLKENVYAKIPLFVRPLLYFIYRYFFRLGFLDGWKGLQWNFLQGLWYRFLVDAKVYEAEEKIKQADDKKQAAYDLVVKQWGLKLPSESDK
ncbi:(heptosyl)LPS beta-1,4-glucosyltransferase [uncultured Thiomicrorhabdus sp.]